MVHLSKIYTKSGDGGTTSLGDGVRVPKTSLRVECYGTVDEANAVLGTAAVACGEGERGARIAGEIGIVQNDLFDVGADLCVPIGPGEEAGAKLRVTAEQTARLEAVMDELNDGLEPLRSFVLPGGTPVAAALHHARTVVRRAERLSVELMSHEPDATSEEVVRYLNRLSDLLFVLARYANAEAAGDVLWAPGKHRGGGAGG